VTTVTLSSTPPQSSSSFRPRPSVFLPSPARAPWLLPALVGGLAVLLAAALYVRFLGVHRYLWDSGTHDRNAHYLYSLKLARDIRHGDLFRLLDHLNQAWVWPPLYGLLAAGVLVAGGPDYRLAVLPSLAGWVGTAVVGFLLARRALPRGGNLAGLVAALFTLASPAHRAYATDIMLESLGACLTLAVLYFYLVAVQDLGNPLRTGRRLGLALNALFLLKYNYWLLVVLALLAAGAAPHRRLLGRLLREAVSAVGRRGWVRAQLRHPLTCALAVLLAVIAAVYARGDRPLVLGGQTISLYPPNNLIHAAYVVVFIRLLPWCRSAGRDWVGGLDPRVGQVVRWHLGFLAFWFLLPKHLGFFLWYLSPANNGAVEHIGLSACLSRYARWAVDDYHLGPWHALLALALAVVGLLSWRRLRPGGPAVFALVLLAGLLTVTHPNQKARCLHSWLAAAWVTAGVGAAALLHGRATARRPGLRPWLAAAVVLGLGWAMLPATQGLGHALEGGPHPQRPCMLDLTDLYLPDLARVDDVAILTAVPVKPLTQWTFLERYGSLDPVENNWHGFGPSGEGNRRGFADWLRTTTCQTLVFLDRRPGSPLWEDLTECVLHAQLRDVLQQQDVFTRVKEQDFPQHGCRVTVWCRR
jgi:hypothetical protein